MQVQRKTSRSSKEVLAVVDRAIVTVDPVYRKFKDPL